MMAAVLLLAATASTLAVDVSERNIRVRAEASPLAAVLEELTSRLEVRLVFDGPRPTTPVSATLEGKDLVAILQQLLEPRRIRYATSRDGARVRTLVVVTASEVRPHQPTPRPTPDGTEPTMPQPFAESVPEPVLPDRPSPPDEP